MRFATALSLLLASLPASAAPARHHVPAMNGPECLAAGTALARVRANGVAAVRVDGDDAAALLEAVNETGQPTFYKASTLVLLLLPDRVVVGLFNACREGDVVLSPEGFRQAYKRMRDGQA